MNRLVVRMVVAMVTVSLVSIAAIPTANVFAERAAFQRLESRLRDRIESFSRPGPMVFLGPRDGRRGPGPEAMPSFAGEAQRLAILLRDLRVNRRAAAYAGVASALVISMVLAIVVARNVARPIEAVSRAASQVAAGRGEARAALPADPFRAAEITALGRDFDAMAEGLERLERERRTTIADIAHELRNPLATLSLRLDAAADGIITVDATEVDTLRSQVALLSRLVDDLRTLSLADAGKLDVRRAPLDVGAVVEAAVVAHDARARAAGVSIDHDVPIGSLWVDGDADRMTQVLHNLLDNAVRVSPAGGTVRVEARATRLPGRPAVRVSVSDEGPGIDVDPPHAIFERYVRDRRGDRREGGGSGLGLAIVRTLVELHGGLVEARNRQPGAEVSFTVPSIDRPEA